MTSEQKGLRLAAGITVITGLAMALSALPALAAPLRVLADLVIWPADGLQTLAAADTRLALAIGGGVLVGWGAMIWQLAGEPLARAPEATRAIIRTSLLAWFIIDGLASVAAGAPLNAVANLFFLGIFLVPMWRGRSVALS